MSRTQAKTLLSESGEINPGPWVDHSLNVARAAEIIASADPNLDNDRAFVFGCLHDIGRRFGVTDMKHVFDGYQFLSEKGHAQAAQICLTHSFPIQTTEAATGKWDCTAEELAVIRDLLSRCEYTEYDRLIQLCDALALPSGFCLIEKRLVDVAIRRGVNTMTVDKWKVYLDLQKHFESRINKSIYSILPGVIETTFRDPTLE